jgi:hypothetical protein
VANPAKTNKAYNSICQNSFSQEIDPGKKITFPVSHFICTAIESVPGDELPAQSVIFCVVNGCLRNIIPIMGYLVK